MASQAEPRPSQSKINALSPSRTPCTLNGLRVTASLNRSTPIAARSLSRLLSRSSASHSASTKLKRRRIAHRQMASASASTARSSRCYAVPCRSVPATGSYSYPPSYKRTVPRRQSRLASRRLVLCSDARCVFRSTSVPNSLSPLTTFARTLAFFSRTWSGRIKSPVK